MKESNNNNDNNEHICYLCKEKTLSNNNELLLQHDLFEVIERKLRDKNLKPQQLQITDPDALIKGCGCNRYSHKKCLIQYMISFIETTCPDCGDQYNIDINTIMMNNDGSVLSTYHVVLSVVFAVLFLILAIVFYVLGIFPKPRYVMWNYILGTICALFLVFIIYEFICYYREVNVIYSLKYHSFYKDVLDMDINELVETKFNIHIYQKTISTRHKEIREFYSLNGHIEENGYEENGRDTVKSRKTPTNANNSNNKGNLNLIDDDYAEPNSKPIDSSHKLIESSNSNNNSNIIKNERKDNNSLNSNNNNNVAKKLFPKSKTKEMQHSKPTEEMALNPSGSASVEIRKKSLKDRSKSPMIIIKEKKEILEDFSPISNKDKEKENNFTKYKAYSNKHINDDEQIHKSTLNDGGKGDILLIKNGTKGGTAGTDIKKAV